MICRFCWCRQPAPYYDQLKQHDDFDSLGQIEGTISKHIRSASYADILSTPFEKNAAFDYSKVGFPDKQAVDSSTTNSAEKVRSPIGFDLGQLYVKKIL